MLIPHRRKRHRVLALGLILLLTAAPSFSWADTGGRATGADCVVLLHGLARTSASMNKMANALQEEGYRVSNIDYPSRQKTIEELAAGAVQEGVDQCRSLGAAQIHFVTHSLGGILVRVYLADRRIPELGRVVMLAPPNRGSRVADEFSGVPGFGFLNGPAGYQLGTGPDSVPLKLGPADFEVGVIAGDRSINLILSSAFDGPNDGKVAVEDTRLEGMKDFLVVHHSHPFIMQSEEVIGQVISFLKSGIFRKAEN
jgi:pimeloyl-ACP methyl ester carboxylesterase